MPLLQPRKILEFVGIILAIELASFFSFDKPFVTSFFFALICAITFVISWKNLQHGLLIAFGELFIGSQGYLFVLERHGSHVPIRMGIFGIVMLVWLIKYFKWNYWKEQFKSSRVVQLFVAFMGVWTLGVVLGFAHHNTVTNILNDSNAYLYWLLFLPVWQTWGPVTCPPLTKRGLRGSLPAAPIVVASDDPSAPVTEHLPLLRGGQITNSLMILDLLAASVTTTTLKTAFTWYAFSKQIFSHDKLEFLYKWIRDTRVGEIVTYDRGGYVRVFFQSHIFELVAVFIFLSFLLYSIRQKSYHLSSIAYSLLASLSLATILMSLSRSFWLAGLVTFALFNAFLIFQLIIPSLPRRGGGGLPLREQTLSLTWKPLVLFFILQSLIFTLAFALSTLSGATTLGSRATNTQEAAVSSRWKLLPPLLAKTTEHPVFGSGFGTTVTYQSDDPRIKNSTNPEGWYTTYAFEWGYLDIITKVGAFGLAMYLVFVFAIAKLQLAQLKTDQKFVSFGLLFGLVALLITHMFTPYLNHPLGIGFILLILLCV